MDAALQLFLDGTCDVLSGLRDRLMKDVTKAPGSAILPGQFMAVQQAVGAPRGRGREVADVLSGFVEEVKSSGLVGDLLKKHGVADRLVVAPLAAGRAEPHAKRPRVGAEVTGSASAGDAKAGSK